MWFQYSVSLCYSTSVLLRTQCLHVYTNITTWTLLSYMAAPLQQNHSGLTTFVLWRNARYALGTRFQFCQLRGTILCVCVCVHACLWKQKCVREIASICKSAVTRDVCGLSCMPCSVCVRVYANQRKKVDKKTSTVSLALGLQLKPLLRGIEWEGNLLEVWTMLTSVWQWPLSITS